jgi:hypothetical protein
MNLESKKVDVSQSVDYLTKQLTRVENYEKLMPDSIDTFVIIDEKTFVFALKSMPKIKIKLEEVLATGRIVLSSTNESMPFSLFANIDAVDENNSVAQFLFEGKFNAMMGMMIKGPIGNFIETLAENLNKL